MRLVFSRKGFDSKAGGVASPILPDGTMISLPIPMVGAPICYDDVSVHGHAIGPLVKSLTKGRLQATSLAHLDPDLHRDSRPRRPGWKPAFGQTGSAQTHLANQKIAVGDLFLFFGWFRQIEKDGRGWRYQPNSPDRHIFFGWLQIGEIIAGHDQPALRASFPWLSDHPHLHALDDLKRNTIYVAADRLAFPGLKSKFPGAGLFRRFDPRLVLTRDDQPNRSRWRLPAWFMPAEDRAALSYHARDRWTLESEGCCLRTVPRGQEFVLDCAEYPESAKWVESLLAPTL